MKPLTPDELRELRNEFATLGYSEGKFSEVIHLVDAVVISFIDQAFGLGSVQLSLSARANYAFNGVDTHANLLKSKRLETVDLDCEGALNTESPEGQFAP